MTLNRTAALVLTLLLSAIARAQSDSVVLRLDETVLTAERRTGAIASPKAGSIKMELEKLAATPRIFGSSDPLRMAESLPGISTNSEIESGIHIQGCEGAHNIILLGSAPIYGSSHLLGLFSTFIPSHFSTMRISTLASARDRIGGEIAIDTPDSIANRTSLSADAGLFFSQGTITFKTGKRSSLKFSARGSYINKLYSKYLMLENNKLNYGFNDENASWTARLSDNDMVKIDLYHGNDAINIDASGYDIPLDFAWHNNAVSARWKHYDTWRSLYYSEYRMNCDTGTKLNVPRLSDMMRTAGYRSEHEIRLGSGNSNFGMELMYHDSSPLTRNDDNDGRQALEALLFQQYERSFNDLTIIAELTESIFLRKTEKPFYNVSPVLKAGYDLHRSGRLEARIGQMAQYLFQTGISDNGFPTEYWLVAGSGLKPQKSRFVSLSYSTSLLAGSYSLSIESYYKRLSGQMMYQGTMVDYFDNDYNLDDHLSQTDGRNYGVTLMVSKNSSRLTGWAAYSFGRSLRGDDTPSSHERIHEFNAVISYNGGRWDCGATFVAASGTPFTAAKSFYLVSEMVIANYGDYNASRLPAYSRLDLSVNAFLIRKEMEELGINFSLYNALGHTNVVSYRTMLSKDLNQFSYDPVAFSLKIMPSISLFYKF